VKLIIAILGALGVLSEAGGYKIFNRQDAKSAKEEVN
jgi:hypothetical protein